MERAMYATPRHPLHWYTFIAHMSELKRRDVLQLLWLHLLLVARRGLRTRCFAGRSCTSMQVGFHVPGSNSAVPSLNKIVYSVL